MDKSPIQQFIDAGIQFTDMSTKQAESIVKALVKDGEVRRRDAEKTVQQLVARGKEASDRINALVEAEVSKQIAAAKAMFDDLEGRVEALADQVKAATSSSAPAKKSSAAKKTTAKKKAPAKKKASAKKATAVGSSGVRKVSTTRKN